MNKTVKNIYTDSPKTLYKQYNVKRFEVSEEAFIQSITTGIGITLETTDTTFNFIKCPVDSVSFEDEALFFHVKQLMKDQHAKLVILKATLKDVPVSCLCELKKEDNVISAYPLMILVRDSWANENLSLAAHQSILSKSYKSFTK